METLLPSQKAVVRIVVRNVYAPTQSLALSVDPQMLVSELKCRLYADFPSSPPVSSQKLIFGGKICNDQERLAQILIPIQNSQQKEEQEDKKTDEPVVFHLLVSSTMDVSKDTSQESKTSIQTQQSQVTEAQDSPRPRRNGNGSTVSDSESFNPEPHQVMDNQSPAMTQEQQNLFNQTVLMQQQTMVLQQIQYFQYLLLQQQHQPTTSNSEVQQQLFGAQFAPPYGNVYGIMQPQMFQARPQEAQTPLPAQAHAPDSTETPVAPRQDRSMMVEMAREVVLLLDFRMALKMAFMLFIIGQDMPTDRIFMLGLLSLISYLHITGIFAKIYAVYNYHRNVNDGTPPNTPADSDAPGAAAVAGAAIANRCGMLMRVLRISADRGFVQDVKYFVVGLLLSLVPAWHPQPIQGAAPIRGNAMPDNMPMQEI
ncbi:hypothetical protein KXD40_007152 [Peronospora effusa]|uniref:Ubiquitin-like domain-containing protein n=1 Tax=Peronospora effusa TaxID=542832 RepID=A0A3M6VA85_9STRA|nr:hypothetical protein DD238_007153 [Peronospora effusa]UIZ28882.1 hypothetical protein KXD40_007152 [Peronospora effusa]CAI5700765.1 unnamed protein product [Peronospora effusa]